MELTDRDQVLGLLGPCPECHSGELEVVDGPERAQVLCRNCGCCWHTSRDWIARVDPATCPGCARRAVCEAGRVRFRLPRPAAAQRTN